MLWPLSLAVLGVIIMCTNKPLVDRGPWYRWAFERLGLEYRHERFFRYLNERTAVFHHKLSTRDHIGNKQPQTIPNPIHNILAGSKDREVSKNAIWTLSIRITREP
jgi:hypothetical protein